jgi:hypothetical protein
MRCTNSGIAIALFLAASTTSHAADCGPRNVSRELPGPAPNAANTVAAMKAAKDGDQAEALRIYRIIDADGLAPALNLPSNYPWREVIISKQVGDLGGARTAIGIYYEKGIVVTRDYAEAAKWYAKSIATEYCGSPAISAAYLNLGRLYLYGLGVATDKAKTKALWQKMSPALDSLVRLLDDNALPKTIEAWDSFDFKQAIARLDARKQANIRHLTCIPNSPFDKDWKGRLIEPTAFQVFVNPTKLSIKITGSGPIGAGEYIDGREHSYGVHSGSVEQVQITDYKITFGTTTIDNGNRRYSIYNYDRMRNLFISYSVGSSTITAYCGNNLEEAKANLVSSRKARCEKGRSESAAFSACYTACRGLLSCVKQCPQVSNYGDLQQCN